MRISTSYQFDTYSGNVRSAQEAYFKIQAQISTGKKFQSSSEDPLGTRLTMQSRQLKARFEQFDKNLRGAKDYLSNSEVSFSDVNDLLNQANVLAIQGASSSIDTNTAQSLANQVNDLQTKLVQLANSQGSQGQYIFAGHKNDAKPYEVNAGALVYTGDANSIRAEVRTGEYMEINSAGVSTTFTDIYDTLEQLKANLMSQDVIKLSDESIANIKVMREQITTLRATVGSRLQSVESLSNENYRRIDEFTKDISDYEEIDLADAFVRYQQAETAYTAAMQVASQGMQLSLMDFLR